MPLDSATSSVRLRAEPANAVEKLLQREWLDQKLIGSERESIGSQERRFLRGNHDDFRVEHRIALELIDHAEAAWAGHEHVGDDDVGPMFAAPSPIPRHRRSRSIR